MLPSRSWGWPPPPGSPSPSPPRRPTRPRSPKTSSPPAPTSSRTPSTSSPTATTSLPGYNTAGNRWRFVNFDSSGDAQGRSAYTDPRRLATITGNGTIGENGVKYIKQSDVKPAQPDRRPARRPGPRRAPLRRRRRWTRRDHQRRPGLDRRGPQPRRPLGGQPEHDPGQAGHQGSTGSRSPPTARLIAVAATTNAPATLSADDILKIYTGQYTKWSDVPGYTGPAPDDTIIPLTLPSDAGMWNTFLANVKRQNPGNSTFTGRNNPNSFNVQQNDPTAIALLPEAQRKNAIVPFPRGRYRTLNKGYYTLTSDGQKTNNYNTEDGHRTAADASAIKAARR
ncbi:hypothetical protein G5V59_06175 [Nocardioides sp. W3-2-3]|nr:hypothetical protein [Nocardioides convexus]